MTEPTIVEHSPTTTPSPREPELQQITGMILKEWERQDAKYPGNIHNSHDTWTRVLLEELGEAAKLLDTSGISNRNRKKLRKELTQVVAVSARWLAQVIREEEDASRHSPWPKWFTRFFS